MTYQGDFTLPDELLEQISTQGIDFIPELIRLLINSAMKAERQQISERHLTNIPRNAMRMATATNQKPYPLAWEKSPLTFLKSEKAASTRKPWKRDCAASGPCAWH